MLMLDALHSREKLPKLLWHFAIIFVVFFTSSLKDFENFSQLKQLIKNTSDAETFILLLPDFVIQFCVSK